MTMDDPDTLVSTKTPPAAAAVTTETASGSFPQATQTVQEAETEPDNIFLAAQRGDLETIRRLLDSGKAKATDRDEQNITPLHWAAINAQVSTCRYLLDQGAEVDALGGDLIATPMQWAARNGYLYVIHLLVAHNADPNITDSQGYNTLHLVTHSSSIMPLLYLLHQPINVDSRDAVGHTSLMWAAYQGDAVSVDLLLKHGASTTVKDDAGLTPLHWAVVRGNRLCIRHLVENGADIGAKDGEGRTPRDMAVELKSLGAWKRALEEGGFTEDGIRKKTKLSDRHTKMLIFVIPTVFFFLIFKTLALLPWYTGIVLAMALFFAMHHIVTRVLLDKTNYTETVTHTPYFAGIIASSMVWIAFVWGTRLVHQTQSHPFTTLTFALSFGLCAYNFFRAITLDPGTCPKPANDAELKGIIEELTSEGRLNGQTFCIQCMARKPLRSKHCRICDRCCARHDHHCPWIWNCVGVNNHRQFLLFVTTLVIGVSLLDYLTYIYFMSLDLAPAATPDVYASCPLPDAVCAVASYDTFLFSVACWASLQLSWTLVLLLSQLWQVARQMTTYEVSNLGRYGFMGGRGGAGIGLASQMGHRHNNAAVQGDGGDGEDGLGDGGHGHSHAGGHAHAHSHGRSLKNCCGCGGFLMQLLGFDRFTKGKAADGLVRASKAANPFDLGMLSNCRDFWTAGRELGVEYERLYNVPSEGFREAKRKRVREDAEEDLRGGAASGGRRKSQGLSMGFSLPWGSGSSGRAGYEPVSQV